MKRFLQAIGLTVLLAASGLAMSGVAHAQETAGGVFVTGHDPDYHAYEGPGPRNLIKKSIDFVTGHKEHPRLLLVTDIRDPGPPWRDSRGGMRLAGFTDFDVADFGSVLPGALDLSKVDFHKYDAIVVASDYGGWLRNDELKVLNRRAADLVEYVNSGGGLVAFAESRYKERYAFLPFLVADRTMVQVDTGMKLTDYGRAMGLTQADVTSGISHNIFTDAGGMEIGDVDGNGNIVSLATKKKISLGGVEAAPVVTATADRAPNANGWYNADVTVSFTAKDDNPIVRIDPAVVVSIEGAKQEVNGTATDASGLVSSAALAVSLDKTAPVVDVTLNGGGAAEGAFFNTDDVELVLNANDALSGVDTVEYRVNGGAWTNYSAPVAVAAEGAYSLDIRTVDKAGNAVEKTAAFAIDRTAPVTTLDLGAAKQATEWLDAAVTVTLASSENGVTEYRLNGGEWQRYAGPVQVAQEGVTQLEYRSTDLAGNVEATHTTDVKVDTTAPTLQVRVDQEMLWSPNHKLVPIHVTVEAVDGASGIASVVLVSITSNEPGADDIQGAAFGTNDTDFLLRAERSGKGTGRVYTITYTATNAAGHETTATATVTVAHDQSGKGGKKK